MSDRRHESAELGPSRASSSVVSTPRFATENLDYPYSPGANPANRAHGWQKSPSPQSEGPMSYRSPDGWGNQECEGAKRAMAILGGQEVWPLEGYDEPARASMGFGRRERQ